MEKNEIINLKRFAEWLQAELDERGWKQVRLAKASGLTTAQVSRLMNLRRGASAGSLIAIADALSVPRQIVLQQAGILPMPNTDPWISEVTGLLENITRSDREPVEKILRIFAIRK